MDPAKLIEGYLRVYSTVYDPTLENYFERCLTLFQHLKPLPHVSPSLARHQVYPALMMVRGRLSPGQIPAYSTFIAKVSRDHPTMLAEAIRLAALGYHFEKFTRHQQMFQAFKEFLDAELTLFRETVSRPGTNEDASDGRREALLARVDSRYRFDTGRLSLPRRWYRRCGSVLPVRGHGASNDAIDQLRPRFGAAAVWSATDDQSTKEDRRPSRPRSLAIRASSGRPSTSGRTARSANPGI